MRIAWLKVRCERCICCWDVCSDFGDDVGVVAVQCICHLLFVAAHFTINEKGIHGFIFLLLADSEI